MDSDAGINQAFCLVLQTALAVWPIILRFMGDLPEPVLYTRNSLSDSVTRQTHNRLSKDSGTQGPQHNGHAQVCGEGSRQVSTGEELGRLGRSIAH